MVRYGVLGSNGWAIETVHSPEIRGREPDLVLDAAGRPLVAISDK